GGTQRKSPDPPHSIDADAHNQRTAAGTGIPPPPISSSRAFIAIRSSEANGSETKISIRRRRLRYSSLSIVARSAAFPVNLAGSGKGQVPVTVTAPRSGQAWESSVSHSVMTKFMRGADGPVNSFQDLLRKPATS